MQKVSIIIIFIFLIISCNKTHEKLKIKVGLNAWPGYEFLYLAKVKNYFAEEGLDVEIIELDSLADGRRAFERKQVDILATNMIELIISRAQSNLKGQVIAVCDYSNGADVILAPKKFKSMKDLKGKRIGVEIGTLTVYGLVRALELEGMKLSDVTLFPTDQIQADENFSSKKIDAMVTYPPFSLNLTSKFNLHEVFTSKKIPKELIDVVVADQDFIEKNQEEVKKFLRAYFKAVDLAMTKNPDVIKIMADREKLSVEDFSHALFKDMVVDDLKSNIENYYKNNVLDEMAKKVAHLLIEIKQIDSKTNISDISSKLVLDVK